VSIKDWDDFTDGIIYECLKCGVVSKLKDISINFKDPTIEFPFYHTIQICPICKNEISRKKAFDLKI